MRRGEENCFLCTDGPEAQGDLLFDFYFGMFRVIYLGVGKSNPLFLSLISVVFLHRLPWRIY